MDERNLQRTAHSYSQKPANTTRLRVLLKVTQHNKSAEKNETRV